ncbi:MAG TPA: hypothetical protein VJ732_13740, partial [Bryobacteraceae bacterium]|nr:hypothetical protein [Bryobacteraceae bacterium]
AHGSTVTGAGRRRATGMEGRGGRGIRLQPSARIWNCSEMLAAAGRARAVRETGQSRGAIRATLASLRIVLRR